MPRPSKTGVRGLFRDKHGVLWIDLRWRDAKNGGRKRHRERLPAHTTMAAAKKRATEMLSSALAGNFDPKRQPPKRLRAAFDAYLEWLKTERPKSVADRTHHARALVASLRDLELDSISPLGVERFKRERREAKRAAGTVNRHLTTMKHFVRKAAEWGWMRVEASNAVRAVRLLREPPGRVRYLSPQEEAALFDALPADVRALAIAADLSGMRRSELASLTWSAVDLTRREIVLTRTKSNRVRRVPIHDALAAVLARLARSDAADAYVFPLPTLRAGARATMRDEDTRRRNLVTRAFKRAVELAGISNLRFHDLRHDFATRVRRGGGGIDAIATLLGHSTLAMAQRYTHVEDPTLRASVRAVEAPAMRRANVIELAPRESARAATA